MQTSPWTLASKRPWLTTVLVGLLFLAVLGIRLFDLTDLPNDFYMVRQYRSLVMARGMYYQHLSYVPAWQRDLAVAQWKGEGLIEPPIMESLVALTYNLTGVRDWMGRLLASLFWLTGALAIWLTGRELNMRAGGLLATAYFLFVPFGVTVSRAFLPDPLMVALIAWSVWALIRWDKRHTLKAAVLAGVVMGLSILVKSNAAFLLLGAAAGLVLSREPIKRLFRDRQVWLIAAIAILPVLLYYIYGLLAADLGSQFGLRFFPAYWKDPTFYGRWLFMAAGFAGFTAFMAALAGLLLYPSRQQRFMLAGLWLGYLALGFTFPYHFLTHDYYHLPVITIVAFGMIPLADALVRLLTQNQGWFWKVGFTALLLAGVIMQMWVSRNTMATTSYRDDASYYEDLGKLIGPGKSVVELPGDYGYRLAYFGWVSGTIWPGTADVNLRELAGQAPPDFSSEFAEYTHGKDLFVITSLDELDRQTELRDYLAAHYPILAKGEGFIIYNLAP